MDGIFNLDKSAGMTSHDVVARVRRLTHQRRVGHAGTLDPAATGVLPVCVGQATRVAEYLSERGKAYRATIRFGAVTDTYDAEGQVVRTAPVALTEAEVAAVLPGFLGPQLQVPPIYSALKRDGRPLYELARAGEAVTVAPRPIVIESLTIVTWASPDLVLDVDCGKGTYIRSLAYDLGERLGPGAHLAALVRTRSGPFSLNDSITLEELELVLVDGTWPDHLYAPDEALLDRDAAILGPASETRLRNGQVLRDLSPQPPPLRGEGEPETTAHGEAGEPAKAPLPREEGEPAKAPLSRTGEGLEQPEADAALLRAYSADGRFLGILRWAADAGAWQPYKVLAVDPVDLPA
ncbi:MAG TPA: tRNA pseudouridine(55) synthase TruB [Ktedonobacterales bacterium]